MLDSCLVGYDLRERRWRKFVIHALSEKSMLACWAKDWIRKRGRISRPAGSMICWHGNMEFDADQTLKMQNRASQRIGGPHEGMVILNEVTGRFKAILEPEQTARLYKTKHDLVFHALPQGFVIASVIENKFQHFPRRFFTIQVYDSRKGVWDITEVSYASSCTVQGEHECLHKMQVSNTLAENGDLHILILCGKQENHRLHLGRYTVFSKEWEETLISEDGSNVAWDIHSIDSLNLMTTVGSQESRIFIVGVKHIPSSNSESYNVHILEYGGCPTTLLQVHPDYQLKMSRFGGFNQLYHSDKGHDYIHIMGNRIQIDCMVQECRKGRSVMQIHSYNVHDGEWTVDEVHNRLAREMKGFRGLLGSFFPGLNPFFDPSSLPDCIR